MSVIITFNINKEVGNNFRYFLGLRCIVYLDTLIGAYFILG